MTTLLCLVRHGRATGQGHDSGLMPEGAVYVATLGRFLHREGWTPAAAFSSPYARARDTARILLAELASDLPLAQVGELTPDWDPDDALHALRAHGLPEGRVLVVSHMPLVARLAQRLTGEIVDFHPGKLAEIELAPGADRGTLRRELGRETIEG
jgi:phosphohistidine phosphatase SixA